MKALDGSLGHTPVPAELSQYITTTDISSEGTGAQVLMRHTTLHRLSFDIYHTGAWKDITKLESQLSPFHDCDFLIMPLYILLLYFKSCSFASLKVKGEV